VKNLRKEILKAGTVRMTKVVVSQKIYSNGYASELISKNQQVVEIGIDDLMGLIKQEVQECRPDEKNMAVSTKHPDLMDYSIGYNAAIRQWSTNLGIKANMGGEG